jgi:SufE protein probably involved in Fe-S center assembly
MTIEKKITYYKESLDGFEDTMDKYKFLLDQGKKAEPFPEEYRQDNFKVSGCQAQVWLVPFLNDKLLSFHTDSDAFISKGMITILSDIYGNNSPNDILDSDFELIKTLNLDVLLTPSRTNGVFFMLKAIKKYAKTFSKN